MTQAHSAMVIDNFLLFTNLENLSIYSEFTQANKKSIWLS